eukprot:4848287-Amphidinium_carterae.2
MSDSIHEVQTHSLALFVATVGTVSNHYIQTLWNQQCNQCHQEIPTSRCQRNQNAAVSPSEEFVTKPNTST